MNMKMTTKRPNKPGFYWWTNFGEHTPTILHVTKFLGGYYASNGEYEFPIVEPIKELIQTEMFEEPIDEDDYILRKNGEVFIIDGKPVSVESDIELWSEMIPCPEINGDEIEPDFF